MKVIMLVVLMLGLVGCKESGSGSQEEVASATDETGKDLDGDQDEGENKIKPDEAKTFMDYCLEEPQDEGLVRTMDILKELTGEKFCGIIAGRLSRMESMDLSFQQISDIRPLRGLTGLKTLQLGSNSIKDISPIATLSGLTNLGLNSNPIEDFSALEELPRLERLIVTDTDIKSLNSIGQITSLTALDLGSTDIEVISELSNLVKLRELSLAFTNVVDISALAALTALESLNISNSLVNNLSPLAGLANLTNLNLTGIPLQVDPNLKTAANCPTGDAVNPRVAEFCTVTPPADE